VRTPFDLGKCIFLENIEVALGLVGVNMSVHVGWISKRKCCRIGPNRPRGSIAKGIRIMFYSRMPRMTVSLMVVISVVGLVLLSHIVSSFCISVDENWHWRLLLRFW
jgi:hypothetical protein